MLVKGYRDIKQWLCVALVFFSTQVAAQNWQAISPNVAFIEQDPALRFFDSNQVLFQGDKCALLLDAPGEFTQTEAFVRALKSQLSVELCYVVASHNHDDHLLGLSLVQTHFPKAKLVVHQRVANEFHKIHESFNQRLDNFAKSIALSEQRLATQDEATQKQWQAKIAIAKERLSRWQTIKLKDPEQAIKSATTLDLGQYPVQLLPFKAHTIGDIAIYSEQDKVLAAGDLVDVLPYVGEGYFDAWLSALDELNQYNINTVLPGHGHLYDKAMIMQTKQWLSTFMDYVRAHPQDDMVGLIENAPARLRQGVDDELSQRAYSHFMQTAITRFKEQYNLIDM